MRETCVVTGSKGFMGQNLVSQLKLNPLIDLYQVSRSSTTREKKEFLKVDLQNKESVQKFISEIRPDKIFHLASKSSVVESWKHPSETILHNYEITRNIVKAINEFNPSTRLIYFSSSAVYARKTDYLDESDDLGPDSPYGISKLMSEMEVQTLERYLILRPFFILGPEKKGDVIDDWFSQLTKAQSPMKLELQVGNLNVVRDFMSCGDAIRLIIDLEKKIQTSEIYNLCSGIETSLRNLMETFIEVVGPIKSVHEDVMTKNRIRDRVYVVGSPSKLLKADVAFPQLDLRKLLTDVHAKRS